MPAPVPNPGGVAAAVAQPGRDLDRSRGLGPMGRCGGVHGGLQQGHGAVEPPGGSGAGGGCPGHRHLVYPPRQVSRGGHGLLRPSVACSTASGRPPGKHGPWGGVYSTESVNKKQYIELSV